MNNEGKKSHDTAEPKTDIERERLKLDKQRLDLDVEAHQTSQKLDTERILLERAKERTTRLQVVLPVLISVLAIGLSIWTAALQYRLQYAQAVSSYNQTRLELFKKLTVNSTDGAEVKKTYKEIFPNDAKELEREQKAR